MINPLVTINILSFNRRDDLRITLTHVFEQEYKNVEVIVVDNASTDGTVEMVTTEYPSVQLLQLQNNIGIAGWNEGFRIAKGKYVLVLDDDSYPEKDAIAKTVEIAEKNDTCAIVACRIEVPGRIVETKAWEKKYYVNNFVGCGALIRRSIFGHVGVFSELLFLYVHELEFSMRVLDKGFSIIYADPATVIHARGLANRVSDTNRKLDHRKLYYQSRNKIIVLFLYFDGYRVTVRFVRMIAGLFIFGLRVGVFQPLWHGVRDGIKLLPEILTMRRPLRKEIQRVYGYGSILGGFFFADKNYGKLL